MQKDIKSLDLPTDSALRIHDSELDAKETSQKIEKLAVCVKPFHLNYNRALWVSFLVNRSFCSQSYKFMP